VNARPDLLVVRGLRKTYPFRAGPLGRVRGLVRAVDGVSFSVKEGETLALVGESGSGKSTIGRTVLRLEEPTSGEIRFRDIDLRRASSGELRRLRREMQIVFQDPFGSLNPRISVGRAIREVLSVHGIARGEEARARAGSLLETVGLRAADGERFPHEFSAGQRQRICLARALAVSPRFLVADEPFSALDASVQAQAANLFLDLQEKFSLSYLIIAHNLRLVRHLADRVAVLYLGRIVEEGPAGVVLSSPLHPYTQALLAALPAEHPSGRGRALLLEGEIPSGLRPPNGCPFHTRCPRAWDLCRGAVPEIRTPEAGRAVACHLHAPGPEHGADTR
jgi:peptide/nickel transport system ATP-binding protein/oligopeptide transport system ATP-binding protein